MGDEYGKGLFIAIMCNKYHVMHSLFPQEARTGNNLGLTS